MKFLSWMHRKLMQNNTETMKNSTIGNSFIYSSEQTPFTDHPDEITTTWSPSHIKYQKSSNIFGANMVKLSFQEESLELFDFLSIGTFGMELSDADPPTPTLTMPNEKITSEQTDITENDLKLLSYELEKFLDAEEKEIANDKSGRNGQASITAPCNKPIERADLATCPLQSYLLANATELTGVDKEMKKEKTSLEELFRRNNAFQIGHAGKCEGEEQHQRKRNLANFMKKLVKKLGSSSSSSMAHNKNDVATSISIKKKFSKALKMLHKKVHPLEMTEEHIAKLQKGNKKNIAHKDACQIREHDENNLQATNIKSENIMKLSSNFICKGASTTTGEHWIKTDSDYLVLEL